LGAWRESGAGGDGIGSMGQLSATCAASDAAAASTAAAKRPAGVMAADRGCGSSCAGKERVGTVWSETNSSRDAAGTMTRSASCRSTSGRKHPHISRLVKYVEWPGRPFVFVQNISQVIGDHAERGDRWQKLFLSVVHRDQKNVREHPRATLRSEQ
jgi:hypothetical protein